MRKQTVPILSGLLLGASAVFAAIPNNVTLRDFFGGLTFHRPVFFAEVPGKDSSYVVVEQLPATGTAASVIAVRRVNGVWTKSTLTTVTVVTNQNQMGLLGFAFHPQYRSNRKYYLSYNPNSSTSLIVERIADTSLLADGGTASRTILRLPQPQTNQNGGHITFGTDGFLYIGFGDGGGNGDPNGNAQNLTTALLGKILRVDLNGADAFAADTTRNYAVPADNPFPTGGRPEVWAYGLRNPWRFSFHPNNGELWAGDVGQGNPNSTGYEEISRVTKGGNMGWPVMEGAVCYPPGTATCNNAGMIAPAQVLARTLSTAVVGGVFFYGNPSGGFHDTYFFGDNSSGRLWAGRATNGALTEYAQIGTLDNLSSFALDSRGRVFAVELGTSSGQSITANTGSVMVLESPDIIPSTVGIRPAFHPALRNGARFVSNHDLLHSGKYSLRSLDGRPFKQGARGVFTAVEKGGSARPFLIPVVE